MATGRNCPATNSPPAADPAQAEAPLPADPIDGFGGRGLLRGAWVAGVRGVRVGA